MAAHRYLSGQGQYDPLGKVEDAVSQKVGAFGFAGEAANGASDGARHAALAPEAQNLRSDFPSLNFFAEEIYLAIAFWKWSKHPCSTRYRGSLWGFHSFC
jgi:hypothetical protein